MLHQPEPKYDLREVTVGQVRHLFEAHRAYRSAGRVCTYAFAVFEPEPGERERERERVVAAYLWQPPPPQAARSVCTVCSQGVLALSRMVAVPREGRALNHVSKPLRRQMRVLIDRTRWPVLITYSDESVGHDGYVYKCSGWLKTERNLADTYTTSDGRRASRYSNGITKPPEGAERGEAWIQRWEHWAAGGPEDQDPARALLEARWERVPVPGKFWRSGKPAHTYQVRAPT